MSVKSHLACTWTLERMSDPHMWTFTFPQNYGVKVSACMWSKLAKQLAKPRSSRRGCGGLGMYGVRVFELHPGGHGLHIHVVVEGRYDVREVRSISKRFGFGRIHVQAVADPSYVAKYLNKQNRERKLRGMRLWQWFGGRNTTMKANKVADVVTTSPTHETFQELKEKCSPGLANGSYNSPLQCFILWKKARWIQEGVGKVVVNPSGLLNVVRIGVEDAAKMWGVMGYG